MSSFPLPRKRLLLYLIPVVIGLGGIALSQQFEHLALRTLVLSLSLAVPLFAGGNLLARYQTSRLERILLLGGVLMLVVGAAVSVSGISESLQQHQVVPKSVLEASRFLGLFSLFLGLFVVLFSVVRTGEDIEEMASRFYSLAEHISEGFILCRDDGTIFLVNNRFLEMFGMKREEIIGRNSSDLARETNLQNVLEQIRNREEGIASEYESTWRVRGEERRFWFSGKPLYDRQDHFTAVLATVRDITEQHRLTQRVERYAQGLQELVEEQTQKLIRSEERFRQLLVSMNEGFLTVDLRHKIRFANAHICDLLKISSEELLERSVLDFVDAPGRMRLLSLLAQGEALYRVNARRELDFVDTDGASVPSVVAVAYLQDPEQGEPLYSLVVTSLAEQKAMQYELELRARELECANEELRMFGRAKDGFLSNVSHELRTPLSTVQGYIEMLESGNLGELEGPQRSALEVMNRNLKRLVGLITEMIEFSRMEIRGVILNYALFYPERLVREALASIHPHTTAKGIRVESDVAAGLGATWGDYERLSQVMAILLNNAVKFTTEGGAIRVSARRESAGTIALVVSDTGIGIEPAYQEKIFTKFYQVDSSKTRRYEGAGIGLSIAKSIVEAHGGNVSLESVPQKGSTFTVRLPMAEFDRNVEEKQTAGFDGLRVLEIEADRRLHAVLEEVLGTAGCELQRSTGGYECLRAAEALQPDLLFLNDEGGDEPGDKTVELLRNHPSTAQTPILIMHSHAEDDPAEAEPWKKVSPLAKPFSLRELIAHMRHACFGEALPSWAGGAVRHKGETPRTKLLVIDSNPDILEWIESGLHRRGISCYCVATPHQGLSLAKRHPPELILLDADAPGNRTSEQVRELRSCSATAGARVVLMSGRPHTLSTVEGVDGFLSKPFQLEQLASLVSQAAPPPAQESEALVK